MRDLDIMSVNSDGSVSSTTGHVEDSKAAVAPVIPGEEKDEPAKDYETDADGNLIDPDTGEIIAPGETETGTDMTAPSAPQQPGTENPGRVRIPGSLWCRRSQPPPGIPARRLQTPSPGSRCRRKPER